ncbi:hypothetical protein [Novosphingobium sp. AAP1]|uniref:hypothetical protein n=1 Tax=Novosphingobium sp. AAP1 TaxID=1523413 RepID=UPI00144277E1|nr:hypothetical protein [Novosphingobium sp. AAP1]
MIADAANQISDDLVTIMSFAGNGGPQLPPRYLPRLNFYHQFGRVFGKFKILLQFNILNKFKAQFSRGQAE